MPKLHGVEKILKVAKNDGNAKGFKVAEISKLGSHQKKDTNASYCDIYSPLHNDKIPASKQDMLLEEVDRVLNLVSSLIEEMFVC